RDSALVLLSGDSLLFEAEDGIRGRTVSGVRTCVVAIDAASGTCIILSMLEGMKLASTRCRPMPSILDPCSVVASGSSSRHPAKKAELSGSATQIPVDRPV